MCLDSQTDHTTRVLAMSYFELGTTFMVSMSSDIHVPRDWFVTLGH